MVKRLMIKKNVEMGLGAVTKADNTAENEKQ